MRTHYDNLKVSENAPIEVIRAAYRALAQKMHPDTNPDNADAHRIMQILNDAYNVLSDPDRRADYDAFLRRTRQGYDSTSSVRPPFSTTYPRPSSYAAHRRNQTFPSRPQRPPPPSNGGRLFSILFRLGVIGVAVFYLVGPKGCSRHSHDNLPTYLDEYPSTYLPPVPQTPPQRPRGHPEAPHYPNGSSLR